MRGEHTIEEQVEQLKEYLGCPCTYYPPSNDCQLLDSDFPQARARGKKEGFVPMLIAVDELLLECFELNGEDKTVEQVRQELLSAPLKSGKELLQEWLRGAKEGWADVDPEFYAGTMAENRRFPLFWLRFRSKIPGRSLRTCPLAAGTSAPPTRSTWRWPNTGLRSMGPSPP